MTHEYYVERRSSPVPIPDAGGSDTAQRARPAAQARKGRGPLSARSLRQDGCSAALVAEAPLSAGGGPAAGAAPGPGRRRPALQVAAAGASGECGPGGPLPAPSRIPGVGQIRDAEPGGGDGRCCPALSPGGREGAAVRRAPARGEAEVSLGASQGGSGLGRPARGSVCAGLFVRLLAALLGFFLGHETLAIVFAQ